MASESAGPLAQSLESPTQIFVLLFLPRFIAKKSTHFGHDPYDAAPMSTECSLEQHTGLALAA